MTQCLYGALGGYTCVAGGGDGRERVANVEFTQEVPTHATDRVAVQAHIERTTGRIGILRVPGVAAVDWKPPAPSGSRLVARNGGPATHGKNLVYRAVSRRSDDQAFAGHGANQVVELGLNRPQTVEDVGVIVLQVVDDERSWSVVDELGASIKVGRVVLVGFDHEKRLVAQTRG